MHTDIRRNDVADLKRRLIAAWSGLQQLQHVIDEAIDHWRGRPHAGVRADGRHFELDPQAGYLQNFSGFTSKPKKA